MLLYAFCIYSQYLLNPLSPVWEKQSQFIVQIHVMVPSQPQPWFLAKDVLKFRSADGL